MHHLVDHTLQTHILAIFRRIDAGYAVAVQLLQFLGYDHSATTAEDPDIFSVASFQQIDHVFEELDMAALI